jgi:hypothetical protein
VSQLKSPRPGASRLRSWGFRIPHFPPSLFPCGRAIHPYFADPFAAPQLVVPSLAQPGLARKPEPVVVSNLYHMIAMSELLAKGIREYKEGSIVKGRILEVRPREVLVDIGYKSEGIIP